MRLTQVFECVAESTKRFSNLPESYIKRSMDYKPKWERPRGPQYRYPKENHEGKRKIRFTTNRPWTSEFKRQNEMPRKFVALEPVINWNFFKGDRVEVLVGRDRGKQGIVSQVIEERNWVIVEGLNCHYRKIGATANFPGTMVKSEAPLLVTNQISLVDPSDNKPCDVEWRFSEEGDRVRVSVRTGRVLPMPRMAEETYDYKTRKTYLESVKDTTDDQITLITFEPTLKTFTMDITDSMGIKEDRVSAKSYWY